MKLRLDELIVECEHCGGKGTILYASQMKCIGNF